MVKKKQVYTITEVMEILQVSRLTVYRYINDGKLKATKMAGGRCWRITHKALQKFLTPTN